MLAPLPSWGNERVEGWRNRRRERLLHPFGPAHPNPFAGFGSARGVRALQRLQGLLLVTLTLLVLEICIAGAAAYGQVGPQDVRAFDLGGVANVEGHAALLANPAHLVRTDRDGPRLAVTVGDVRAYAGGDLVRLRHYQRAFIDGRALTDDEAASLLDDWFGEQQRGVRVFAEAVPLAVSRQAESGRWAVGGAVRMRSMATTRLDRGLFDLVLRGARAGRTVPVNMRFQTYAMADVSLAYSRHFPRYNLRIGVAPKAVVGGTFADGRLNSSLDVRNEALTHEFQYVVRAAGPLSTEVFDPLATSPPGKVARPHPFRQIAGTGAGVDVGASQAIGDVVTVAVSLTDLGVVRWRQDAQRLTPRKNRLYYDGVAWDERRIQNEFGGRVGRYFLHELDSLARDAYADVERASGSFTTPLPMTLHLGVSGRLLGSGRPHLQLGLSTDPRSLRQSTLHVSARERVGVFPFHVGMRFGADHALALGVGTGLHAQHYRLNVGALVTPYTSGLGAGGRYALSVSLATLHF